MNRDEAPVPADLELVRSRAAGTTQQGQLLIHYSTRPDIGSPEPEQVLSRMRSRWNMAGGSWPLRLSFALASNALKRHLEGPCYDWFLGCSNRSTFDDALHLLYELGCATSGRPPTLGLKKPQQTREFARSFELLAGLAVDYPDRLGQRFKWWDGGQVTAQIPLDKLGTSAVRPLIPSKILDTWQSEPEAEWWIDLDCFHAIAVAAELVRRHPLHGKAKSAADYIQDHPGEIGNAIARAIQVSPPHFRRLFRQKLRPHGYHNAGSGYFPPGV